MATISPIAIESEAPPLRVEPDGAVRIGNSRVLLEMVIHAFQEGDTPEGIVQRFSSTSLSDVYSVIAYYLRHRAEVESYLARRDEEANVIRKAIEQRQGDMSDLRARLLARRKQQGV